MLFSIIGLLNIYQVAANLLHHLNFLITLIYTDTARLNIVPEVQDGTTSDHSALDPFRRLRSAGSSMFDDHRAGRGLAAWYT